MLFHILILVLDHELVLDNFLITNSVLSYAHQPPGTTTNYTAQLLATNPG